MTEPSGIPGLMTVEFEYWNVALSGIVALDSIHFALKTKSYLIKSLGSVKKVYFF